MAVLNIPTAFLGCPRHETLYMCLPEGESPDPYGRTRPLANLNKTLYGIKQANQEYIEEVIDFMVDNLGLHASIAAPGLFFGGNLGEAHRVLNPVYVDDIMSIGNRFLSPPLHLDCTIDSRPVAMFLYQTPSNMSA